MCKNDSTTLAGNAFIEQKRMNLPWYRRIRELQTALGSHNIPDPLEARRIIKSKFTSLWRDSLHLYKKLDFYRMVKSELE